MRGGDFMNGRFGLEERGARKPALDSCSSFLTDSTKPLHISALLFPVQPVAGNPPSQGPCLGRGVIGHQKQLISFGELKARSL